MAQTFFHCSSLKALDLSNLTSSSITNTNRMFCGCESLLYLNMNNLDLSNVDDATYMFYNMKEINYLEIKGTKLNEIINNEIKGEYGLNNKDNLMVCKNDENFSIGKYVSICCDYDIELKKCKNYIVCKYKEAIVYKNGFGNNDNINIAYIKNGNSIFGPKEKLTIEENDIIEIYFSEPITSLDYFFWYEVKIKLIDLSHFDSSLVTDTGNMFEGCSSLEEINFNNFNTSKVTNMEAMFDYCSNLKSLDLSNFDTSNVNNMKGMFQSCESLEYLDISNFDTSKVQNFGWMFGEVNHLKYIKLYNAKIDTIKNSIPVTVSTIVCQNNKIISRGKEDCSIFTQSDNYIIVKYGTETTYRPSEFKNQYRQQIQYIKYEDKIVDLTQELRIEANGIIQIYLPKDITSLEKFFSKEQDENVEKIKSIDLSYLDSSTVDNTENMFYQCSSLEEINFNNFNKSKVTSMYGMFQGCSSLKSLDLSNFDISKVEVMTNMFSECTSLEYLDISNFNTLKVNMFLNVNPLKYINLYNAQIEQIKNGIKGIIQSSTSVCQKDDFKIVADKTYIKACCVYNDNILKCYTNNYITVQYNTEISYDNGFKISKENFPEFRKDINFIKNEENIITPSGELKIKSNSKIEIHLDNSIQSLAHFFNSDYDDFTKNIVSIDFSHFDSSLITDMKSLFSGCSSLQKLDLRNFLLNSETSMENMFSGCDNLKYLDISGFNITSYDILNRLSSLKFINIYKAQNYDINAINNITEDLNICQKEKSIQNLDIENKCGYFNIDKSEFDSTNLIIIYFNENVKYKSGFVSGIESRNNIEFLINGDKINAHESLSINKGKKLEIYLDKETTSLKSFFDSDLDPNMIDFTFFDSSKVTNMENLFKECSELKEIDFTNFNTSLVTSMASMFSGCSKLIELDISFFDTSSVINMHDMFYECEQLKLIDLYDTKMDKIITAHNMFKHNENLKYIDLLKVKDSYINITESEINLKDNLTICQKDNIIINTNAIYKCCYYNTENDQCESNNYIILFYQNEAIYKSGFSSGTNNNTNISFRDNIEFLAINRKK